MRLKNLNISEERLEMQLCKKSVLYLKRCGVQQRKTTWGWHDPPPTPGGTGTDLLCGLGWFASPAQTEVLQSQTERRAATLERQRLGLVQQAAAQTPLQLTDTLPNKQTSDITP